MDFTEISIFLYFHIRAQGTKEVRKLWTNIWIFGILVFIISWHSWRWKVNDSSATKLHTVFPPNTAPPLFGAAKSSTWQKSYVRSCYFLHLPWPSFVHMVWTGTLVRVSLPMVGYRFLPTYNQALWITIKMVWCDVYHDNKVSLKYFISTVNSTWTCILALYNFTYSLCTYTCTLLGI